MSAGESPQAEPEPAAPEGQDESSEPADDGGGDEADLSSPFESPTMENIHATQDRAKNRRRG